MRAHEQERFDRAHQELRECRVKLQRVHEENQHLRTALAERTDAKQRDEIRRYRKALSYIGCAPGGSKDEYEHVARVALDIDSEAAS